MNLKTNTNTHMRKVHSILFLMFSLIAQAQFNLGEELKRMVNIPQSAEAAAFTTYGTYNVGMYTGTPDISIPLGEIEGMEMNLPIGLNYDATGIKVEALASSAGMNWTLTCGGMITRITQGLPDDYQSANPPYETPFNNNAVHSSLLNYLDGDGNFTTVNDALSFLNFKKEVGKGYYETNADLFSVNAPGLNTMIVFDVTTMLPVALNNPRLKVEFTMDATTEGNSITGWKIINDAGTQYYFELAEKTVVSSDPESNFYDLEHLVFGALREYNSAWYLTKIISANQLDTFDFDYTSMPQWMQDLPATPIQIAAYTPDNNASDNNYGYTGQASAAVSYNIFEKILTGINHNNKSFMSIDLKSREDHSVASAIDAVHFHAKEDGSIVKMITLEHSYFGDPGGNMLDKRLKLDDVRFSSGDGTYLYQYSLEYKNPEGVPSRTDLGQDYLGYFNDKNNSVLYPKDTYGNDTYAGADRSPVFSAAERGMLSKIIYPTGGFTTFGWAPHSSPFKASEINSSEFMNVYGSLMVTGGTDASVICNNACDDVYVNTPPKVASTVFNVPDGTFDVSYGFGGEAQDAAWANAYLVYLGPTIGNKLHTALRLDEIVNNEGTYDVTPVWEKVNGNTSVALEAGSYQLMLVNGSIGDISTAKVSRMETTELGVPGEGSVTRAGIRIGSIASHLADGSEVNRKVYQYINELGTTTSSGKIINQPLLRYVSQTQAIVQENESDAVNPMNPPMGLGSQTIVMRKSYASNYGPHVVYKKVVEYTSGEVGGTPLGYTEHVFDTGPSGLVTFGTAGELTYYAQDTKAGKPRQVKIFDNETNLVQEIANEYIKYPFFLNKSLSVQKNGNVFRYPVIVPNVSDGYHIEYHDGKVQSLEFQNPGDILPIVTITELLPGTGELFPHFPDVCDLPGNTCYESLEASGFDLVAVSQEGEIGNIKRQETVGHFPEGSMTAISSYLYDDVVGYQLRESSDTLPDGNVVKKIFYYPEDEVAQGGEFLIQKNALTEVVKQESYLNDNLVATREHTYANIVPGVVVLNELKQSKGFNIPMVEMTMEYDNQGKLVGASRPDGVQTRYIWGYEGSKVIAQLEGIQPTDLPLNTFNVSQLSNLDIDESSEEQLIQAQQLLKDNYPDIGIKTFTYTNGKISSSADERGRITRFDRDTHERLVSVLNHEGDLLETYAYNHKEENVVDSFEPLGLGLSHGADNESSQEFIAVPWGGSGDFSFAWYIGVGTSDTDFGDLIVGANPTYTLSVSCDETKYVECWVTDNVTGQVSSSVLNNVNEPCPYPPLFASISYGTSTNFDQSFTAFVSGGSGDYSYAWHPAIGTSSEVFAENAASIQPQYVLFSPCESPSWVQLVVTDNVTGEIQIKKKKSINSPCSGEGGNPQKDLNQSIQNKTNSKQ